MIPNAILLYSLTSALSSYHQKSFSNPLAADGNWCRDSQPALMWKETLNWGSPMGPSLRAWETQWKRGRKYCRSQRRWMTPGEHGPLDQLSRAHMGSQLKKQAQGMYGSAPGPLHVCYSCLLGVLRDILDWEKVWPFCLLLGLFFSYWVALPSLIMMAFALSYCIILFLYFVVVSWRPGTFWRETEGGEPGDKGM